MAAEGLPAELAGKVLAPGRLSISDWVFRENRGVVLNGEIRDERFRGSAGRDAIGSAMSVPIKGPGGPIGVLNLARGSPEFSDTELAAVERLVVPVARTIERLKERALAQQARLELLAAVGRTSHDTVRTEVIHAGQFEMAVAHAPSVAVSGDLWEHITHPEGAQVVMLADVAGEGPIALRDGAFARGLLTALARSGRTPAKVASSMSRELHIHLDPGRYVAAWIARTSPGGGLISCNAGIPAPLWVPIEGGDPKSLGSGGPALGAVVQRDYEQEMIRMLSGDVVVAVTDGTMNAADASGQSFGAERISELAMEGRRQPAERLADTICQAALAFAGSFRPPDDLVVMVLRYVRDP